MSNLYGNGPHGDGGGNPYGPPPGGNPYGPPPGGSPYGGAGYGQYPGGPYGGGPAGDPPMDGVSLTGFVLSLVCCGPVGLVLGIVGLGRTRGGRRRGRWAAVAAIVVGVLTTVAAVVGGVALARFAATLESPSSADVGDCVDLAEGADDVITMRTRACDEPHDAEIVHQGEFTPTLIEAYDGDDTGAFCMDLVSEEYEQAITTGPYTGGVIVEAEDPDAPEEGDAFVCYVEHQDGAKLEAPVTD